MLPLILLTGTGTMLPPRYFSIRNACREYCVFDYWQKDRIEVAVVNNQATVNKRQVRMKYPHTT
jgi:hypothetical protein